MVKETPKIKADDFVFYEGADENEKFTHFQELSMRVNLLIEMVDELTDILRENNIARTVEVKAPYFDEEDLYQRLDKE